MGATKLTLSMDRNLVEAAKKRAADEGISLSLLVARFLRAVVKESWPGGEPGPRTRRATGLVRLPRGRSDRRLLEEALEARHGRRSRGR